MYAGVASAVAFMGPKRRWPPVFYFSSMMAADGEAGHRLVALHAPGFCRYLHGAATGMGVSAAETGDAVRGGGVDSSNDARAPLLVELAWSGELLNRAPTWGGNWLRRVRGGRWISELHSSYPAGYPAGMDAE